MRDESGSHIDSGSTRGAQDPGERQAYSRETDVLIQVVAAGVNRADLIQRGGHYPAPPGVPEDIPGLEIAGVIESAGAKARRWKAGDAVCALLAGGGYVSL